MRVKNAIIAVASVACLCQPIIGADFAVINTASDGPGSLRQAILDANALSGADRIVFNIPGAGRHTIDVSENFLPTVTDSVTIDGYTQPGAGPNTLDRGTNATILIQIDGGYSVPQYSSPRGIEVSADHCVVRGLMVTRFAVYTAGLGGGYRAGGFGIAVGGRNNVIEGNFIGTDGSPDNGLGNKEAGIGVTPGNHRIGGNTPAARNLIAGNHMGIFVRSIPGATDGVLIAGNQIGTDAGGASPALGNTTGVVFGTSDTTLSFTNVVVGGREASLANLIAGNDVGISLGYTSRPGSTERPKGVVIEGNLIGLQPNRGSAAEVNQRIGVDVLGATNLIGGLDAAAGNQIAFNQTGVAVSSDMFSDNVVGNRILSNLIHSNSVMDIDLGPTGSSSGTGSTPNDLGDADNGPNRLQNFPVLGRYYERSPDAPPAGYNGLLEGVLNSTPSTEFLLQFFYYRPRPTLLGNLSVTTDAAGNARFSFLFYDPPGSTIPEGSYFAATATDPEGNTSELSPVNGPVQLANISTRGFVGTEANIMIGGFIVRSDQPKKLAIRALGPSMNVPNSLQDPHLELYDASGTLLVKNDDWKAGGQQEEVTASGLAPANDLESVIIATLPAGTYTAQVSGVGNRTGNAIVEAYDLDRFGPASGRLVNISTRGFVGGDDNVLIGGLIVRGDAMADVVARAIGPDLSTVGVANPLQDPVLELRDASGQLVAANDNWREDQQQQVPPGLQPADDLEAAIAQTVAPGLYTAVVSGKDGATGVALVEFYDLKN